MESLNAAGTPAAREGVAECSASVLPEAPGSVPPGASGTAPDSPNTARSNNSETAPGWTAGREDLRPLSGSEPVERPPAPSEAAACEAVGCTLHGQPGEAAAEQTDSAAKRVVDCGRAEAGPKEGKQGAGAVGRGDCSSAAAKPFVGGFRDRRTGTAVAASGHCLNHSPAATLQVLCRQPGVMARLSSW